MPFLQAFMYPPEGNPRRSEAAVLRFSAGFRVSGFPRITELAQHRCDVGRIYITSRIVRTVPIELRLRQLFLRLRQFGLIPST